MTKTWIWVLGLLFLLTGCIELEEKISIGKDGSGMYDARFVLSKEFTSMLQEGLKAAGGKSDIPMSPKDLEGDFKGEGVQIVSSSFNVVEGRLVSEYRIAFKDATTFFNVPGMRKRFRLYGQGDRLVLRSISQSGMQPGDRPFPGQAGAGLQGGTPPMAEPEKGPEGMEEMQGALQESMKAFLKGFRVAVTVELPNPILESNATQVEGRAARWVIDENTFAEMGKGKPLDDQLWASCSLMALGFRPSMEKGIFTASAGRPGGDAAPAVPSKPTQEAASEGRPPDGVTSGGKSVIVLKNGNSMKVDGFLREGDMLTVRKYGGTISLPLSEIQSVLQVKNP